MLMTQEEFAKLLDISFATLNRWENGRCSHAHSLFGIPTLKV